MRHFLTLLFWLGAVMGMAQTADSTSAAVKMKWSAGGVFMFMGSSIDHHYYDRDNGLYIPQTPIVWFGPSRMAGGIMQGSQTPFHLSGGFPSQMDCGFTLMQFSRNLYKGIAGFSVGLQVEGQSCTFSDDYVAKGADDRVEFVSTKSAVKNNRLSSCFARVPLLVGVQTPRRWLSLQTGLGLYAGGSKYHVEVEGSDEKHHLHTSHVGVQWLLAAGIGPVLVTYTHHLTPLFTLTNGTKAYPSSFTVGIDVFYFISRFTGHRE